MWWLPNWFLYGQKRKSVRHFFTLKILSHYSEPMREAHFGRWLCPLQSAIRFSMTQNLQCEKVSKDWNIGSKYNELCSWIISEKYRKFGPNIKPSAQNIQSSAENRRSRANNYTVTDFQKISTQTTLVCLNSGMASVTKFLKFPIFRKIDVWEIV